MNPLRSFVSNILSNYFSFIPVHSIFKYHSILNNHLNNHSFLLYITFISHMQQQTTNNNIINKTLQFNSLYNEGFIVPLFSFSINFIYSRSISHFHSITFHLYAEFVLYRVSISKRFQTQTPFTYITKTIVTLIIMLIVWTAIVIIFTVLISFKNTSSTIGYTNIDTIDTTNKIKHYCQGTILYIVYTHTINTFKTPHIKYKYDLSIHNNTKSDIQHNKFKYNKSRHVLVIDIRLTSSN